MSEAKHSPLPWSTGVGEVVDAAGELVADCDDFTAGGLSTRSEENAALIVRAVNAHENLLAALVGTGTQRQFGVCWCRTADGTYCVGQPQCMAASAALAKATGAA